MFPIQLSFGQISNAFSLIHQNQGFRHHQITPHYDMSKVAQNSQPKHEFLQDHKHQRKVGNGFGKFMERSTNFNKQRSCHGSTYSMERANMKLSWESNARSDEGKCSCAKHFHVCFVVFEIYLLKQMVLSRIIILCKYVAFANGLPVYPCHFCLLKSIHSNLQFCLFISPYGNHIRNVYHVFN